MDINPPALAQKEFSFGIPSEHLHISKAKKKAIQKENISHAHLDDGIFKKPLQILR